VATGGLFSKAKILERPHPRQSGISSLRKSRLISTDRRRQTPDEPGLILETRMEFTLKLNRYALRPSKGGMA
jgi:hypothetical protein